MRSAEVGTSGVSEKLASELAGLAGRLRRSTVRIRAGRTGAGSGVAWRADGLIVTNAHVARSRRLSIVLWDGRSFSASIEAADPQRDLAALLVEASDLCPAPIGDSDGLRAGQFVFAVGNPLGLAGAVSTGIIHAVDSRRGTRGGGWIQADVRLLPGNSGGPLADAQGRVIGVNSMIAGGLALAVPSSAVARFLGDVEEQLCRGKAAHRVRKGAKAA